MTEGFDFDPHLEALYYRGFKLSVRQTPMDWIAIIALPSGQPVVAAGHDRETAIAMATAWIDGHVPVEQTE
jgi:predicted RNase H-like HicB family nuclease